jgi:autotransporter-associated beta strand protein
MRRLARFERLEPRILLTSTSWIAGSGLWDQPSNWSNGVPTASVDALINPASAATITIQPGETVAAQNLTLGSNAALTLPGGGDPSVPTSNLLTGNAGLELPTASSGTTRPSTWGYWGSSYLSSQYAFSGNQSIVVSGGNSGVTQSFNVSPGASYTASIYAMTPAANRLSGSIYANLQLLFFDSGGNLLSSYSVPNQLTVLSGSSASGGQLAGSVGGEGWNHFFTTAAAPSNAVTARIQLTTYATTSTYGGAVYYDAAQFGPAAAGASTLNVTSIASNGSITVGPTNKINVSGGFTQNSTGTLDVQLGGAPSTGSFGSLTVSGTAALGGKLEAEIAYSYAPSTTDSFTPVTFASATGGFSTTTMPNGAGFQFAGAASFTNVLISAAPSAATSATVNVGTHLHSVATSLMGINMAWWDSAAVTSQTQQMAIAAGLNLYRFPGGSSSDEFHFTTKTNFGDPVAITIPQFAQFITSAGGTGLLTLDYGSASPQEAAAELAYLLGTTEDTTAIGSGLEWDTTTGAWKSVDWKTAGYWASLRAASPLATDDGLNFLRIGRAAPFSAIKYWEVGNEEYGVSWETDHHGTPGPGGVSTGAAHDPATYVSFAKQFGTLVAPIVANAGLPAISIGIDSGDPTGGGDNNWTQNVLSNGLANGFVPGFISDHSYMQGPGGEDDSFLLNQTVSNSNSNLDWSTRYGLYQTLLQQTLGGQASSVAVMATELNSVYTNPGKQSTSLVNGLFIANSLGSLITSGYSAASMWDLRNGWDTSQNNSNLLYGWRKGGDYGVIGPSGQNNAPYADTYIAYPNYFALQLVSKIIAAGGQVVSAASNYGDLNVYAVKEANGDLELLVINTNPAADITNQFSISGFQPAGSAQVWQYGKAEDLAQSLTSNGAAALTHASTTLSLSGANFTCTFPAYSMTVLDLSGSQTLTSVAVSLAANHFATTGAEQFMATAYDQYGNPLINQPSFAWSVVGAGLIDSSGNYQPPYATGSAVVKATAGSISGQTTATFPGTAQWNAGSSTWAGGSWIGSVSTTAISPPGLRGVSGDMAQFATNGGTISLNGANPSLAGITFAGSVGYTIASGIGGTLNLDNGANPVTISVTTGSHAITAPVTLRSSLNISAASGSILTIAGGITGNGQALTLNGSGKLILSGNNSFNGGTAVVSGTLVVGSAAALASGSNLTVGANVSQAFVPVVAAAPINAQPLPVAMPSTSTSIRDRAIVATVEKHPKKILAGLAAVRPWFFPSLDGNEKDAAHRAWDAALARYGSE